MSLDANPSKNASALVTGASSGIGAAIAVSLSKQGHHVLLAGRSIERLKKVQEKCPSPTTILSFDLRKIETEFSKLDSTLSSLPKLEVLVNNAGVFQTSSFAQTTNDSWSEQFEVNFFSAVKLTRHLWPIFIKNKKASIVNISSSLGNRPSSGTGAYSASKAAMNNWTLNLAQEGGEHNIRANVICPGIIDTPIHSFHDLPEAEKAKTAEGIYDMQLLRSLGTPQDIANAVSFLASDDARWITGVNLVVDGGISLK